MFDEMFVSILLWLIRCLFSLVLMIDTLIDWVSTSGVTLMIVDECFFGIPIMMMASMFQHLYVCNADDDLVLDVI